MQTGSRIATAGPSCRSSGHRPFGEPFEEILDLVNRGRPTEVLEAVLQVALGFIAGVDWVSISLLTGDGFHTAIANGDEARHLDKLQYQTLSGPSIDRARDRPVAHIPDTSTDDCWPEFARRAAELCGVRSVLTYRFTCEGKNSAIGSLNLYSRRRRAFGNEPDKSTETLIATACALAVSAAKNQESATTLAAGMDTNREIGVAMGILMYSKKLTAEQAFNQLRVVSQHSNRKLRDIAAEVAETGAIEFPLPSAELPAYTHTRISDGAFRLHSSS